MSVPDSHEVTELLGAWSDGDEQALDRLAPLVQAELHRLARRYMSRERGDRFGRSTPRQRTSVRSASTARPTPPFPLWAPDGARLLFRIESASYVLDLARGWGAQTPEQVPRPPTPGDFFGAWNSSPDGKKLAGTFAGTGGTGFGYYSFETGKYERVAEVYALPYWLPDSRRIVY